MAVSAAQYDTTLYNGSFSCKGGDCGEWDIPLYWGIGGSGKDSCAAFQDIDPANYQSEPGGLTVWHVSQAPKPNGEPKDVRIGQNYVQTGSRGLGFGTPAAPGESYTYDFWVKIDSLVGGGAVQIVSHYSNGEFWVNGEWQKMYIGRGPTGDWLHITGSKTVPSAAWWAKFYVYVSGWGAVHVDDIMINSQAEAMDPTSPPNPSCCEVSVEPTDYHQAMLQLNAEAVSGDVLRVFRADGRAVNAARLPGVNAGRQLAPGCYVITRQTRNGVISERMLTK